MGGRNGGEEDLAGARPVHHTDRLDTNDGNSTAHGTAQVEPDPREQKGGCAGERGRHVSICKGARTHGSTTTTAAAATRTATTAATAAAATTIATATARAATAATTAATDATGARETAATATGATEAATATSGATGTATARGEGNGEIDGKRDGGTASERGEACSGGRYNQLEVRVGNAEGGRDGGEFGGGEVAGVFRER